MGAPVFTPSAAVFTRGPGASAPTGTPPVIFGRRLPTPTDVPTETIRESVPAFDVAARLAKTGLTRAGRERYGIREPGGEAPVGEPPRDLLDLRRPRQELYDDIREAHERHGTMGRMAQVRRPPVLDPPEDAEEEREHTGPERTLPLLDAYSENFDIPVRSYPGASAAHRREVERYQQLLRGGALEYAAKGLKERGIRPT